MFRVSVPHMRGNAHIVAARRRVARRCRGRERSGSACRAARVVSVLGGQIPMARCTAFSALGELPATARTRSRDPHRASARSSARARRSPTRGPRRRCEPGRSSLPLFLRRPSPLAPHLTEEHREPSATFILVGSRSDASAADQALTTRACRSDVLRRLSSMLDNPYYVYRWR